MVGLVLAVLLVSAGLRLYHLGSPGDYMFDEVYYAKDAKAIVDGRVSPPKGPLRWEPGDEVSWPHPEAGKLAIALGVLVFGDRPAGWRIAAVVAGLALLACVYPVAMRLGLPRRWAFVALLFAACDLLGIAQSRIATLDIFVGMWTIVCVLAALRYVQDGERLRWLLATGVAGGLAVSTKWSGALALLAAAAILVLARAGRGRALLPPRPAEERADGHPWWRTAALASAGLVLVPAAVYVACYAQYFAAGHTLADFRELHSQMWHFNLTLDAPHSYASVPPTWLFDYRPVWYSFVDDDGVYRGIVAMGNPFLWWAGAAALIAAPLLALRRSWVGALAPATLVAVLYLPWFAATRTSFLYYMTPVAPLLAVLVAALLWAIEGGKLQGPRRAWPRPALAAAAAAAAVTALLWWPITRMAELVFWELPGHAGAGASVAVTALAVAAALAAVGAVLVAPRCRRVREIAAWGLVGVLCGIVVPFLPIVMGLPISADDFYRLIWFTSWI